jgi:hypothetical protein
LDAIVDEWRDRIPRDVSGRLTDEPHRLVPLTYTFLKDIEERNQQGAVVKVEGVKEFQCNHMKCTDWDSGHC